MRWTKLPDIVFRVGGVDGMKLTDAVNAYFNGPDGRDEFMFTNESIGSSFSCRIIVCSPCDYDFHSYSNSSFSLRDTKHVGKQDRYVWGGSSVFRIREVDTVARSQPQIIRRKRFESRRKN